MCEVAPPVVQTMPRMSGNSGVTKVADAAFVRRTTPETSPCIRRSTSATPDTRRSVPRQAPPQVRMPAPILSSAAASGAPSGAKDRARRRRDVLQHPWPLATRMQVLQMRLHAGREAFADGAPESGAEAEIVRELCSSPP